MGELESAGEGIGLAKSAMVCERDGVVEQGG